MIILQGNKYSVHWFKKLGKEVQFNYLRSDELWGIAMRVLPLVTPPITTYPSIANILSLMWSKKNQILPWFSDHFIQIMVRLDHEHTFGDFYDHADIDNYYRIIYGLPGLGWMRTTREASHFSAFSEYIEKVISNGYGIEACIDRFYLKCTKNFQTKHFIHSTFIYGFDEIKREVYLADFWEDGKYGQRIASYEEIDASMNNDYLINLFKAYDDEYEFDFLLMKRYVEDYIQARDSFDKFAFSNRDYNHEVLFGIDYYKFMIHSCTHYKEVDSRLFHLLFDHKTLMQYRIKYLISLNRFDNNLLTELLSDNADQIKKTLVLRNSVLKYNVLGRDDIRDSICNHINELKVLDYNVMERLLNI